MEQREVPSSLSFRKAQRKGNLQQSPQPLQLPVLFLSTGNKAVSVRLIFGIIVDVE